LKVSSDKLNRQFSKTAFSTQNRLFLLKKSVDAITQIGNSLLKVNWGAPNRADLEPFFRGIKVFATT